MTTTCQQIIDLAKARNALNAPLASNSQEMMTQIRGLQQRIFTACAGVTRDRFKVRATASSSSAASEREVDLTASPFNTQPIERILQLKLANGTVVNLVDELDPEAELAPRYVVRGTKIIEVSNDWSTASGPVTLTVLYVYGQTAITITASPSSTNVSIPDDHIGVLEIPLAMYMHLKDPGREPQEYDRLEKEYVHAWETFIDYLTNYGGTTSQRFSIPAPPEIRKQ